MKNLSLGKWWRTAIISIVIGVMMLSVCFIVEAEAKPSKPPEPSYFTLQTIDSVGDVGKFNQIMTDSTGAVHIIYYDATAMKLKHATNAEGTWSNEVLASIGASGDYIGGTGSFDIDPNDNIHVAYVGADHHLYYGNNIGGQWSFQVVNENCDLPGPLSLKVDSTGGVHMSYCDMMDPNNPKVVYAAYLGTSWSFTTIAVDVNLSYETELAVNGLGDVFIAYTTFIENKLYLVSNVEGWSSEVVDPDSFVASGLDIEIDDLGHVHLAYFIGQQTGVYVTMQQLRYAVNDGDGWSYVTVGEPADKVHHWPSLAIDDLGRPHICYNDLSSSKPNAKVTTMYATMVNGIWSWRLVDTETDIWSSIAVDDNKVYISYNNGDLRLANTN